MRTLLCRAALAPLLLLIGLPAQAATWVLDPEDSHVYFKYKYGNDPYQGEFTNVEARFEIDLMNPGACDFSVTIHINDIGIESPEVLDYLLDFELLDVDQFPTASFKAESCRLTGIDSFESDGILTVRDETHPMTFPFNLSVETSGGKLRFHLTSEVTIQRLMYGVGQGYWANTGGIPNDVDIIIDVYAVSQ